MLKNFLKFIAPPVTAGLSKNAMRRLRHTRLIHDGPMRHQDGTRK